jgi:hypothetical protein
MMSFNAECGMGLHVVAPETALLIVSTAFKALRNPKAYAMLSVIEITNKKHSIAACRK